MSSRGWIGVDLDGTLAYYDRWKSPTHIGAPIDLMVDRVKRWLSEGREVKIMTARVAHAAQAEEAREAIEKWCEEHIGQKLEVTCCKDLAMIQLWDDRVVQVRKNTGERML
jgi:hypothetical protein